VLIDLDVAPAPSPDRVRQPPWRALRIVIVAVVLLLLGGAGAPPRRWAFTEVGGSGGRATMATLLSPEALYTAHGREREEGGVELFARPLAPGGPSWNVTVDQVWPQDGVRLIRSGSVLVVSGGGGVAVLDPRTGREVWPASEWADVLVLGDRAVLVGFDEADTLRLADLATGRILWTRRAEVGDAMLDATGQYLLVLDRQGGAQVRSAADGRLLGSRHLDESVDAEAPAVTVAGDRAYVFGPTTVTALRLADLAPAWPRPAGVLMPSGATACGDLICVRGARGVTALDPGTGAVRWTSPDWFSYVDGVARAKDGRIVVLDPATGRVTRKLGRGEVTGGLMLRAVAGNTEVADLRTGQFYGTLPGVLPYGCKAVADLLACSTLGGTTVWRMSRTVS
jgi:outer membrane protein assembly factor BamB